MVFLAGICMILMWIGILVAAVYFCLIDDLKIGWFIFALFIEYFFARAIYGVFLSIFA